VTGRRFPPPWSVDHSPSTRRVCSSRISGDARSRESYQLSKRCVRALSIWTVTVGLDLIKTIETWTAHTRGAAALTLEQQHVA
jgi:hypothetical protein